jgi:hypothetical protein
MYNFLKNETKDTVFFIIQKIENSDFCIIKNARSSKNYILNQKKTKKSAL